MARPKKTYDVDEVEEIVKLTLKSLNGIREKLTPNLVWTFNKELGKDDKKLRENGKPFTVYGYHFWYTESEFGRKKIDEIKSAKASEGFILAGESFVPEMKDIAVLVTKFHKRPDELIRRLNNLMIKDRDKLQMYKEQYENLKKENTKLKEKIDTQKRECLTLFMESANTSNSLPDVLSLKRSDDDLLKDELYNVFGKDLDSVLSSLVSNKTAVSSDGNVIHITISEDEKLARIKELEGEGF
jgi:hypothetical protein